MKPWISAGCRIVSAGNIASQQENCYNKKHEPRHREKSKATGRFLRKLKEENRGNSMKRSKGGGIREKLVVILLLGSLLPLSIVMILIYICSCIYYSRQAMQSEENLVHQFRANLELELEHIKDGLYQPYERSSAYQVLTRGNRLDEREEVYALLQSIRQLSDEIVAVRLEDTIQGRSYLYANWYCFVSGGNASNASGAETGSDKGAVSDIQKEKERVQAESPAVHAVLLPTHKFDAPAEARLFNLMNQDVFTCSMALYSVPQNEYFGRISIDVGLKWIEELAGQMLNAEGERLMILDGSSGIVIYDTAAEYTGLALDEELVPAVETLAEKRGNSRFVWQGTSRLMFYEGFPFLDTDWLIFKIVPASSAYLMHIFLICLAVYLVFLLFAVLLVWRLSEDFTRPIIALTKQMKKIKYGEPYEPLVMNQKDEIGVLNQTFHSMLETINEMIIQEYELKLSNRNAQLRMLQAQLNPHFLNNALQSLGTLSLKHKAPELYTLILSLSQMMNYAMDIDQTLIPLEEEFEYARNYLAFQKERFGERLHTELEPAPETLSLLVPKMMIQPIMENYFKHGFVKRQEGYRLRAVSRIQEDRLVIQVENNGSGIPEEKLRNLEKTKTFDNEEGAFGIGLINIQSRLNLYYQNKGQVCLYNLQPYGLRIEVILSLKPEVEMDEGVDRG